MRAEKPGMVGQLTVCNYAYNGMRTNQGVVKEFPLTTEWKRYEVVFEYPKRGVWGEGHRPDAAIAVGNRSGAGAIWVDAVQFEKGSKATAYEP